MTETSPASKPPQPPPASPPVERRPELGVGLERLIFFSDAVFAIAITLLVIDVRLPDLSGRPGGPGAIEVLRDVAPKVLSYVLSFVVIGAYWVGHHRIFALVRRYDARLLWVNLAFLMFIAFIPFPTAYLNTFVRDPAGPIVYALSQAAAGLAEAGLWFYVSRSGLLDAGLNPRYVRYAGLRLLRTPAAFLLSIPLAFIEPDATIYGWAILLFLGSRALRWRFGSVADLHPELDSP